MTVVPRIILPVKPLALGKSRLADRLGPRARHRLNRGLFARTLSTVVAFAGGPSVLVVSRDADALAMAAAAGAGALPERGPGGLNAALEQALCTPGPPGEEAAMLVVPVDLPLLTADDLAGLVKAGSGSRPRVALAPDRSGRGTNALLAAPPGAIPFRFGPDSFDAHAGEAHRRGIAPRIVRRPGLAFDLDTAADYDRLLRRPGAAAVLGRAPVAAPAVG